MRKILLASIGMLTAGLSPFYGSAQITLQKDYKNYNSPAIGTFQGINFREAGFSGLYAIPGTDGKEFWTCSDRGVNIDAGSANPSGCTPTYDKIYAFPNYAPKIHRIRINGDSIQILQTIAIRRPNGTPATGIINPTGLGSTATEVASTDTVLNCANFNLKVAAKDTFGIDCEGIIVDKDGYFWLCEEGGPTIWKLNRNGVLVKRFTPYANLGGAQSVDVQIDTAYRYRKNNRGFEGITLAPNGKIYAMIQSPLLYPNKTIGESSRMHRLLEIDPVTNATRMFVYMNDGVIGTGSNQIRLKDWKLSDIAAINDSTFLVMEAAARGTTDIKRLYKISINGATVITSGLYNGSTVEALDSAGLVTNSIVPVRKTLVIDLLANNWPSALDKAEGVAIVNDSTIAICNDNDYGQSSPAENGIATASNNLSHLVIYSLKGSNKLSNYVQTNTTISQGATGISSSATPYLVPTIPGAWYKSILTTTDKVNGYMMAGIPDGLGIFDNYDGTFTMVSNQELGNTQGATHAWGSKGSFVSKWIIKKSDLSVVYGGDLTQKVFLWNPLTSSYVAYNAASPSANAAFSRFCSADLAPVSAYYNAATGLGTQERIFLDGEESGDEGRAMAHILTGVNAGNSYELPAIGKFSHENEVANPATGDKTVVGGMDDATPGQVYFYIGTKTNSGTEIEKAGLTNGTVWGPVVNGMLTETSASVPAPGTSFTMVNLGNVTNMTGATLQANSNTAGVTQFLRPEDGAWDPQHPEDFYFNTTNAFSSPSRLWKMHFSNINDMTQGGTITAVLDGTEGQKMLDNMTIDNYGHIILQEDVGNNVHLGKVWQYDIATDVLTQIGVHDSTRFLANGSNYLTQDEESSGAIDAQEILGPGMFLTTVQDHHSIAGDAVEGGQFLAFFNPDTYNANPEVDVQGNNISILNGDTTPSATDFTDMGSSNTGASITKAFVIKNSGPGTLKISGISFGGANASEFTLAGSTTFPINLAANGTQTINVQFTPTTVGVRNANITIKSNDFDEKSYDFALKATGTTPEITVMGNGNVINDGDVTPGGGNNTDFGIIPVGSTQARTFTIQNLGSGPLTVSKIIFTGPDAQDISVINAPTYPVVIAPSSSQNITVQMKPSAVGVVSGAIAITNDDADESNYDFGLTATVVSTASIASNDFYSAMKLYPNPTGNEAIVEITLIKAEQVTVMLTDLQGKTVAPAIQNNFGAGDQKIVLNTSTLPNGTYYVSVACGSSITKTKLVVLH
ncbi:MAG: esterase-like activity of phytase family protein [Bacteroidetes bacterium]|nr:esterase-like activity of phytase family protein [Bacteroidota bacterium]